MLRKPIQSSSSLHRNHARLSSSNHYTNRTNGGSSADSFSINRLSLDDIVRRMQSSSLVNPYRSLASHFPRSNNGNTDNSSSSSVQLLKIELSARLLGELKEGSSSSSAERISISLDESSLILANVIRHGLSPELLHYAFSVFIRLLNDTKSVRSKHTNYGKGNNPTIAPVAARDDSTKSDSPPSALLFRTSDDIRKSEAVIRVVESMVDHEDNCDSSDDKSKNSSIVDQVLLSEWAALLWFMEEEQFVSFFLNSSTSSVRATEKHLLLLLQFYSLFLSIPNIQDHNDAGAGPLSLLKFFHFSIDEGLLKSRTFQHCESIVKELLMLLSIKDSEGRFLSSSEIRQLCYTIERLEMYENNSYEKRSGKSAELLFCADRAPTTSHAHHRRDNGSNKGGNSKPNNAGRSLWDTSNSLLQKALSYFQQGDEARTANRSGKLYPLVCSCLMHYIILIGRQTGNSRGGSRLDGAFDIHTISLVCWTIHQHILRPSPSVADYKPVTASEWDDVLHIISSIALNALGSDEQNLGSSKFSRNDVRLSDIGQVESLLVIGEVFVLNSQSDNYLLLQVLLLLAKGSVFVREELGRDGGLHSALLWCRMCALLERCPLTLKNSDAVFGRVLHRFLEALVHGPVRKDSAGMSYVNYGDSVLLTEVLKRNADYLYGNSSGARGDVIGKIVSVVHLNWGGTTTARSDNKLEMRFLVRSLYVLLRMIKVESVKQDAAGGGSNKSSTDVLLWNLVASTVSQMDSLHSARSRSNNNNNATLLSLSVEERSLLRASIRFLERQQQQQQQQQRNTTRSSEVTALKGKDDSRRVSVGNGAGNTAVVVRGTESISTTPNYCGDRPKENFDTLALSKNKEKETDLVDSSSRWTAAATTADNGTAEGEHNLFALIESLRRNSAVGTKEHMND